MAAFSAVTQNAKLHICFQLQEHEVTCGQTEGSGSNSISISKLLLQMLCEKAGCHDAKFICLISLHEYIAINIAEV